MTAPDNEAGKKLVKYGCLGVAALPVLAVAAVFGFVAFVMFLGALAGPSTTTATATEASQVAPETAATKPKPNPFTDPLPKREPSLKERTNAVLERRAQIYDDHTRDRVLALVALVRARGYRCDSVSAARPTVFSPGFELNCNSYRYEYQIRDRGGRWTVEVK